VRPWKQLAAEARAHKFRYDTNVLHWQAEHLGQDTTKVDHALRGLVERQVWSIPDCGCGMGFKRVMGFVGVTYV